MAHPAHPSRIAARCRRVVRHQPGDIFWPLPLLSQMFNCSSITGSRSPQAFLVDRPRRGCNGDVPINRHVRNARCVQHILCQPHLVVASCNTQKSAMAPALGMLPKGRILEGDGARTVPFSNRPCDACPNLYRVGCNLSRGQFRGQLPFPTSIRPRKCAPAHRRIDCGTLTINKLLLLRGMPDVRNGK